MKKEDRDIDRANKIKGSSHIFVTSLSFGYQETKHYLE
ncbi:hypothetical protein BAME_13670 [Bacillus sp. M 2-6]|nr:hypothetical protein BAME_13670 [Bacillus sp. M 2-6]